jgi:hypothetical protein
MTEREVRLLVSMTLDRVRELARNAGEQWLNGDVLEDARARVELFYDSAPERQAEIQAAWAAGWREGFGPVDPAEGHRLDAEVRKGPLLGREAYLASCQAVPLFHDGTPRPTWEQLSALERFSWNRSVVAHELADKS